MDKPIIDINVPKIFAAIVNQARYKIYYGGRGSEKSWTVARYLIAKSLEKRRRILCAREYQNSIQESVHHLLEEQIYLLKLRDLFDVKESYINSYIGSEFIFKGIAKNIENIKSMEGVDIVWVEEAERISQRSLDVLIPTIRAQSSELLFTFNPQFETDPIYKHFVKGPPPPESIVQLVNWQNAPHFPETLRKEMEYMRANDYEKYLHVWEGHCRTASDAQIFKNKFVVEEFSSDGVENFRFGADFGFAKDPATLSRCFIKDRRLYVDYVVYGYSVEMQDLKKLYEKVPLVHRYKIKADSSRPETIAFLKRMENGGFNIEAAEKWPNSVEEGIEYLRGAFDMIVIHPRNKDFVYEATAYRYKVDPVTDEILPVIVDADNHGWDSLRYSMDSLIKRKSTIYDKGVVK